MTADSSAEDIVVRLVDPSGFDWAEETGPAAEVRRITASADAEDGADNLNEAARLHLKNRGLSEAVLHLADGGFALMYDDTLDLVVAPESRRAGVGTALASASLRGRTAEATAWSHADHPGAARIAAKVGLRRERELWVMRRPLDDTLPEAEPVHGYRVRAFRPGDEEGLLEANRLAFAHHPEQGNLSLEDFRERTAEPWFDPEGLFLAVPTDEEEPMSAQDTGTVLGFHWTKVHPEGIGEVYVVAVNPRSAGRGIGKVLTAVGLRHLRDVGLPAVILYVDADNDPAVAVYRGLGFGHLRTEVQYRGIPS